MKQSDYMVCVKCLTFNQSKFVKDTLDGFCLQKTSFPYVCIIIDDASTDGEQDVISNFFQANFDLTDNDTVREEETSDYVLRFARHKKNVNCYFAVLFLKYNHYNKKNKDPYIVEWTKNSRYMALCEGDDYWTDSSKLQKQVDFLETHDDYVLTCHRYRILNVEEKRWEKEDNIYLLGDNDFTFDINYRKWITKTLTLVFRASAYEEYNAYPYKRLDIVLVYFLLKKGLGYCFKDEMGVYRRSFSGINGKKGMPANTLVRYNCYRDLYLYDKNAVTRKMYYLSFIQLIWFSHGRSIKHVKFSISDFIYLPYYFVSELFRLVIEKL